MPSKDSLMLYICLQIVNTLTTLIHTAGISLKFRLSYLKSQPNILTSQAINVTECKKGIVNHDIVNLENLQRLNILSWKYWNF